MKGLFRALFLLTTICAASACAAPPAAESTPGTTTDAPIQLDRSCKVDADCAVKNVGNCCGAAPACVNVDSPTDPEGVMAQCRATGRMSVCGFREITGCQCVQGKCAAKPTKADTLVGPPRSPEVIR